jgi:hypothetical protein
MSDAPLETEGAPTEEDLSSAKAKEQLETDPEGAPNAPNRDPHETPDEVAEDSDEADVEPWRSERAAEE